MVEVVDLRTRVVVRVGEPEASFGRFLLDEGLDLLADYRRIADPAVRAAMRDMVRSVAAASERSSTKDQGQDGPGL